MIGEPDEATPQLRRCTGRGEGLDAGAGSSKRIQRHIDPVEITVVLCAILQMIVDL